MHDAIRRAAALTLAAVLAGATASCGSSEASGQSGRGQTAGASSSATPAPVPSIASQVPKSLRDKGQIVIGYQNTASLPYGTVDDQGHDIGLSVDAARAIAGVLGLEPVLKGGDWDPLIPGLQAGRYDLVTAIATDKPERRAVVDYVNVTLTEGSSFVTLKGGKHEGTASDEACGLRIAVNVGSTQEERAKAQSAACTKAGKSADQVLSYKKIPDELLALKSNRVDAVYLSAGASRYVEKTDDTLSLAQDDQGKIIGLDGFLLPKGSALTPAVRAAMLYLNDTGQWKKLLGTYGLEDRAPSDEVIENTSGADVAKLVEKANEQRSSGK